MKVIRKTLAEVDREDAHDGSGEKRLYASRGDLQNEDFEAFTCGFLPGGRTFDWHYHEDTDEMMIVIKGSGLVRDREGEYEYHPGDFFIFPANVEHAIHNPTSVEHEYIFVRLAV
jgi:quercetin dioxygenase-like cupin family protein